MFYHKHGILLKLGGFPPATDEALTPGRGGHRSEVSWYQGHVQS